MKINGPNHSNMNPYLNQKQIPKKTPTQQNKLQPDQVEISEDALKLQKKDSRQAYVNEIKQQVETGEYKPNAQETAKKMVNFWKK